MLVVSKTKLLTENILPGNDYSSIKERDKTHRQKTISVSLQILLITGLLNESAKWEEKGTKVIAYQSLLQIKYPMLYMPFK